jgi:hypothetical protein
MFFSRWIGIGPLEQIRGFLSTKTGRYETDKPVAKNAIKPKNGLRPKNKGEQKQNRGRGATAEPTKSTDVRTCMMNYFTEVCVESSISLDFEEEKTEGGGNGIEIPRVTETKKNGKPTYICASLQKKSDKKCSTGSCLFPSPPYRFFFCVFWRFSMRGTQKRN